MKEPTTGLGCFGEGRVVFLKWVMFILFNCLTTLLFCQTMEREKKWETGDGRKEKEGRNSGSGGKRKRGLRIGRGSTRGRGLKLWGRGGERKGRGREEKERKKIIKARKMKKREKNEKKIENKWGLLK